MDPFSLTVFADVTDCDVTVRRQDKPLPRAAQCAEPALRLGFRIACQILSLRLASNCSWVGCCQSAEQ